MITCRGCGQPSLIGNHPAWQRDPVNVISILKRSTEGIFRSNTFGYGVGIARDIQSARTSRVKPPVMLISASRRGVRESRVRQGVLPLRQRLLARG